jgi:hypothetical protein
MSETETRKFEVDCGFLLRLIPSPKDPASALADSIEKWEFLAEWCEEHPDDPIPQDGGIDTCALCQLYEPRETDCIACPVKKRTGKSECDDTPYIEYWRLYGRDERAEMAVPVARDMADFLKSLQKGEA